jgi:hypothetical protein
MGHLEHASGFLRSFLDPAIQRMLFIPYAGVTKSSDQVRRTGQARVRRTRHRGGGRSAAGCSGAYLHRLERRLQRFLPDEWWKAGFVMSLVLIGVWVVVGAAWWKLLGHW